MISIRVFTVCVGAGVLAFGQVPVRPPSFEAVSVKRAAKSDVPFPYMTGGPGSNSPGQLLWRNVTIRPILVRAFGIKPYQLVGPPAIDQNAFDIVAKIPAATTQEKLALMLQELLRTRFGLIFHKDTRVLPVYELSISKAGLKMKPSPSREGEAREVERPSAQPAPDGSRTSPVQVRLDDAGMLWTPVGSPTLSTLTLNGITFISGRMKTIADLLGAVESHTSRIVVDRTSLTGKYDFALRFESETGGRLRPFSDAAARPGPSDLLPQDGTSSAISLREAFGRQLGLTLEDGKGSVSVIVVDRVNGEPTEN